MNNINEQFKIGGMFYLIHERDGKIIEDTRETLSKNIFVEEGLIYGLNAAFHGALAGGPTIRTNLYLGLSTANRVWQSSDQADDLTVVGSGIHTVGLELETYDQLTRPEWIPQALASTGSVSLSNIGAECVFTINADATVEGAFVIDNSDKSGASDGATALLVAGSNFTGGARQVFIADVLRVGYILNATSA